MKFPYFFHVIFLLSGNSVQSSQTESSRGIDSQAKESSEDSPINHTNDNDSKLHAARYNKNENDWDELLAQVCSSPIRRRRRQMLFFFTIMIVRVPPSSLLSVFLPLRIARRTTRKKERQVYHRMSNSNSIESHRTVFLDQSSDGFISKIL